MTAFEIEPGRSLDIYFPVSLVIETGESTAATPVFPV